MSYLDLAPEDPQQSSSRTLTNASIDENDRQLNAVQVAGDTGTRRATRLNMAAQSLGINNLEIVKNGAEYMEGALPMERFLAEKDQSTFAKIMAETKEENKDGT